MSQSNLLFVSFNENLVMYDVEQIKNLLTQAKNGDTEAFGTVYESYFSQIYRYIYFRVKDKELTEDLVQTVFIKIFVNLDSFNPKYPRTYFFTVAKNIITDHWRKKKDILFDEKDSTFAKVADHGNDPHSDMEDKERNSMVQKAIGLLQDDQQEVVQLKFIHQLSNKEIAQILNKNETAVRQLQCRGLKKLREYFKENNVL